MKAKRATAVTAQWHVYMGTCCYKPACQCPIKVPCCLHWGEAGVSGCMHAQGDANLGTGRNKNQIQKKKGQKKKWNSDEF